MKFLLPILNLALAIGLFFMFTDQVVVNAPLNEANVDSAGKIDTTKSAGGIRALLVRQGQLNEAISTAKEVGAKVNELNGVYNSFAPADIAKLDDLLPDHVDNIQLIIDVNGIAKENGMAIKNIKFTTSEDDKTSSPAPATNPNSATLPETTIDSQLGSLTLSFSVTGTYSDYKKFIADIASSLRVIDISSSSFSTDDKGVYTYDVALRTYWLK